MKSIFIIAVILIWGCTSTEKIITNPPKADNDQLKIDPVLVQEVNTGWNDEDTYTVRVSASDEKTAIEKARHQILKDIVNVRVRNQSRYTDISKIQDEFSKPLETGQIIQKNYRQGEIEIFYRITDNGLKKKFERQ